jgi:hypothetical protein
VWEKRDGRILIKSTCCDWRRVCRIGDAIRPTGAGRPAGSRRSRKLSVKCFQLPKRKEKEKKESTRAQTSLMEKMKNNKKKKNETPTIFHGGLFAAS